MEPEAEISQDRVDLPGGWALQIGPFAALAVAALYLRSRWASLPERFPVHWGLDGRPNGWATRNLAGVYGPLLIAAVIAATMALFARLLQRQAGQIHHAGVPAAAERRFRRTVLWTLLGSEYLIVAVSIWVSLLPLAAAAAPGGTAGPPPLAPVLGLVLTFVAVVTVVLVRAGRGMARPPGATHPRAAAAPGGGRSPDRCWKAGIFYFNPDDPAVFVVKRIGIGYTFNFAHPVAWLLLGVGILAPLAVALWVAHAAS
jgi:uncharacterized membrane protein